MTTKRQIRKLDFKYCFDCGKKFKKGEGSHKRDSYEPRDCIYGMTEDHTRTGKVICHNCHAKNCRVCKRNPELRVV